MSSALAEYWLAPVGETAGPAVEVASMTTVLRVLSAGAPSACAGPPAVRQNSAPSPSAAATRVAQGNGGRSWCPMIIVVMRIILIRIIEGAYCGVNAPGPERREQRKRRGRPAGLR